MRLTDLYSVVATQGRHSSTSCATSHGGRDGLRCAARRGSGSTSSSRGSQSAGARRTTIRASAPLLASLAMAAMSTACVVDRPEPQAAIVQQRDDWPRFLEELPRNNYAAARALERYRRRHGLPQAFFVPDSVPPDQRRGLAVDEDEMCGKGLTAFVTWIP